MAKRRFVLGFVVTMVPVSSSLVGCRLQRDPIEMTMRKDLQKIHVGMTRDEFTSALPKAYRKGEKSIGGKVVEAWEVKDSQLVGWVYIWVPRDDYLWFYFFDGVLVKWGPPGSWPEPPDLIIEHRAT